MSKLLEGARCLITGGSRGLGRAISIAFARHGARVAFTYRRDTSSAEESARLVREAGHSDPIVLQGTVTDSAHAKQAVDAVVSAWGAIDALVNCAAVMQVLPISLLEEQDFDNVMAVNVKGVYLFSRAALRPMIRAKSGSILNIGNFSSERVIEAPVHYAASKSAVRGLTEALAREVGRYGIRVNLLAPGMLDTGLALGMPQHRMREYLEQCPMHRVGRAEEVAELAAFLVSSESSFVSGAKLAADGGL